MILMATCALMLHADIDRRHGSICRTDMNCSRIKFAGWVQYISASSEDLRLECQ